MKSLFMENMDKSHTLMLNINICALLCIIIFDRKQTIFRPGRIFSQDCVHCIPLETKDKSRLAGRCQESVAWKEIWRMGWIATSENEGNTDANVNDNDVKIVVSYKEYSSVTKSCNICSRCGVPNSEYNHAVWNIIILRA